MNSLNDRYIAKNVEEVIQELENLGYKVIIKKLEPKRDKDILNEEIVIKLEQEENNIILTTSMFKKYI